MQFKKLIIKNERILVIGPIYNKMEKLLALKTIIKPDDILVFMGNISFPYKIGSEVTKRINQLDAFCDDKKAYYIVGDLDLIFKSKNAGSNPDVCGWLQYKSLGLKFSFENNTNIIVINGSILPEYKKIENLNNNLEISFYKIDDEGKHWHDTYDGRFGFVVSNYPYSLNNKIKIYNHSVSLNTRCNETNILAVQEITNKGLGQTFYL